MQPTTQEPSYFVSPEARKRSCEILASAEGRGLSLEDWRELYPLLSEHGRSVIIEAISLPEPEKVAAREASKHRAAAPQLLPTEKITREREVSETEEHLSRG